MKTLTELVDEWLDEGRTVVLRKGADGRLDVEVTIATQHFKESLAKKEKKQIGFSSEASNDVG